MPKPSTQSLPAVAIALLAAALAPGVAGAAEPARVTAVAGTAQQGADRALEHLGGVAEEEPIETSEDGGCSLLLEEDALIELCGRTTLSLRRREPGGPRVLDVQRGDVRVSAEPRLGDERIEIHTPAAIATILGTVVFVSVDALGVTTITSEVSKVMVGSSDPAVKGQTLVDGGQQLVIEPGEAPPPRAERLDPGALADLGGCLVDFHQLSLEADREKALQKAAEELTGGDAETAVLPQVAVAGDGTPSPPDDTGPPLDPTDPPFESTDNPEVETGPPSDDFPEPCPGGIPGDQCGPF
jgi:hypothetical protein